MQLLWPMTAAGAGYDALNITIDYYNRWAWANTIKWSTKALCANDFLPDQRHVAYVDRALAQYRLGRYGDAINVSTAAISIRPDDLVALTVRADAYTTTSRFEQAAADLGIIYIKQPDGALIGFDFGPMSRRVGNYDDAGVVFSSVVKQYPSAWLWWQLADVRTGKSVSSINDQKFDQNQ